MNLIEQLGGYEKTKRELELKEQNSVFQCCTAVDAEMIRSALLQHRREHGIFEVGDLVCYRGGMASNPFWDLSSIFLISEIWDEEIDLKISMTDSGCFPVRPHQIDHASDKEIKANKRLEVG